MNQPSIVIIGFLIMPLCFDDTDAPPPIVNTTSLPIDHSTTSLPIIDHNTTSSSNPTTTGDQEIDLISTTNHHTTSSLNQATTKFTDQGIQDRSTTSSLSTDNNHEGIATVASTLQEISSIIPYAVGGAVGGFVVIIVITLVIIVVPLLVRKRREKSHKVEPNNNIGLLAYDNAMYDVGKETGTQNAQIGSCIVLYIAWAILIYTIIWYQFTLLAVVSQPDRSVQTHGVFIVNLTCETS